MLIVVCGLPGAGKTTVAETASDLLDAELVRSDVVRKDLFADPEYTDEEERMVYGALIDRGRTHAAAGRDVVLDATFHRAWYRELAAGAAGRLGVEFELVKVECPSDVVERRIAARTDDESDADFEVHLLFRDQYEPLGQDHVVVDNAGTPRETVRQVRRHLGGALDEAPPVDH